ncbi:uncharacterized protein FA14DRAFT_153485 [Meira miltonrushii]|uniref:Uncharacterized protein n=1 Tax=Meira miltonrushii TaxID=1280837 RepID=A0A316VP17_9BASI|nr:uncharacterized protein FA14DRAFT_153485 [Meira miltonrushii]PWN38153.1 hypothetical protein FA14DRAFT_153485 [Meira miltonrushii]
MIHRSVQCILGSIPLLLFYFNSNHTAVAVSLRRRLAKFGQDPNSPPKTTDYMHPQTLREIRSRTSQHTYHRRINTINQELKFSRLDVPQDSRPLGYSLSKKQRTDQSTYIPALLHVYSRKIQKDTKESPTRQTGYKLRSKNVHESRKIVNTTKIGDSTVHSEQRKVKKTKLELLRDRARRFKARSERIRKGTASDHEIEQYTKHLARNKQYRENNREKFNESSRRAHANRRARLRAEKE